MRCARPAPVLIVLSATSGRAFAAPPMSYLSSAGRMGDAIAPLTWGLLGVAIAVVVIISALVIVGILRRGRGGAVSDTPIGETRATSWIGIGVGLSTLVLIGLVVWTSLTMASIANPPSEPALTIEVRGHQWWWEFIYHGEKPNQIFETANEIHIPVGKPVRFAVTGMDVIHSFWVPSLGGKTETIPGQVNVTWLQADRPGVYRGECSEYCGEQHAHMALAVFADAPDSFEAWRQAQLRDAPAPASDQTRFGEQSFIQHCGACHTVRGSPAAGRVGPDLTHLMSRSTIAAGVLPNNPGYLSGWIADPQNIKPGCLMPDLAISGPDLASIRSFLLTLK